MAYLVRSLIPALVLYVRQYDVLTRDELVKYLDESMAMRDEANLRNGEGGPLVHTITDARHMIKHEVQLNDMQTMLRSLRNQRVGWSLYVSSSKVTRFLVSVAHQIVGVRHYICATMDEALLFINRIDDSLPPLKVEQVDALIAQKDDPR
ncbi:MAG: hypothetical protein IPK19_36375 [Chloroflexi bacterium]|nr:hypothetical protein [Chloroflexota bacterium]